MSNLQLPPLPNRAFGTDWYFNWIQEHKLVPGAADYDSGNVDIEEFVRVASEYDLTTYWLPAFSEAAETIVFSHSLGTDSEIFSLLLQSSRLRDNFNVLLYDHYGCSASSDFAADLSLDAPITLETNVEIGVELLQALNTPVHWAGVSLGSMVGMLVAHEQPQLLKSVTLMSSSAEKSTVNHYFSLGIPAWVSKVFGVGLWFFDPTSHLTFSPSFYADSDWRYDYWENKFTRNLDARLDLWKCVYGLIQRGDLSTIAAEITENIPFLILHGGSDTMFLEADALSLHDLLPQSEISIHPTAGHTLPVEEPQWILDRMMEFYQAQGFVEKI